MRRRSTKFQLALPTISALLLLSPACLGEACSGESARSADRGTGDEATPTETICDIAEEMAETGAFYRDRDPVIALQEERETEWAIEENLRRLMERFEETNPPSRLLEQLRTAEMVRPLQAAAMVEEACRTGARDEDFSCPAFSYLHLPKSFGDASGFGGDLFWICHEARTLSTDQSREEAASELLANLRERQESRFGDKLRTSAGREIIAEAENLEPSRRLQLIEEAAREAGIELSPSWCENLYWAWGGEPLSKLRAESLCSLVEEMARADLLDRKYPETVGPTSAVMQLTQMYSHNWDRLWHRFTSDRGLGRHDAGEEMNELFRRALEIPHSAELEVMDLELERLARETMYEDLSCPAFSYLYLPEWAGEPDGPGRDLFWMCFHGTHTARAPLAVAGESLVEILGRLPADVWRSEAASSLIERVSDSDQKERFALVEQLAESSGISLDEGWCAGLTRAWGPEDEDESQPDHPRHGHGQPAADPGVPLAERHFSTQTHYRIELESVEAANGDSVGGAMEEIRRESRFGYCLNSAFLRRPPVPFSFSATLKLDDSGHVMKIRKVEVTEGNDDVVSCALHSMKRWRIGEADGARALRATWKFDTGSQRR